MDASAAVPAGPGPNSAIHISPSSMLALVIWPVSRTIRTGTKLRIVPVTALQRRAEPPVHDVDDRRAVALDRGHGDTAGSASGSTWRSGVAGSIHWLFCSIAVEHVRLADEPGVDQLPGVLDRRGIPEREADLGPQALGPGQLGRLPGLAVVGVHRLLAQHVLARAQRVPGDVEVRPVAGDDVDHVDVRVVEQLAVVGGRPGDAEPGRRPGQGGGVGVGERDDLGAAVPLPAGDVGALRPAPRADHRDAQRRLMSSDRPALR